MYKKYNLHYCNTGQLLIPVKNKHNRKGKISFRNDMPSNQPNVYACDECLTTRNVW